MKTEKRNSVKNVETEKTEGEGQVSDFRFGAMPSDTSSSWANPVGEEAPQISGEMSSVDASKIALIQLCDGQLAVGSGGVIKDLTPERPVFRSMVTNSVLGVLVFGTGPIEFEKAFGSSLRYLRDLHVAAWLPLAP